MAAGLIASLIPLLEGSAAGVAAKGTMDMNKKKEGEKAILDDGLLSKSNTKVKGENKSESNSFKTLSQAEKDELMIDLVMGGLTTKEAVKVISTGYISKEQLAKLPPEINRKLAKITGIEYNELLSAIGGAPDPNDDDETKKEKASKREKLDKQIEDAKQSVENYKKGEAEFQKTDAKTKKINEAKRYQKGWNESSFAKNTELLENSPEQKAEKIAEQMKDAAKHGRLTEWEYNNVSPTSNIPVRP